MFKKRQMKFFKKTSKYYVLYLYLKARTFTEYIWAVNVLTKSYLRLLLSNLQVKMLL